MSFVFFYKFARDFSGKPHAFERATRPYMSLCGGVKVLFFFNAGKEP